MSGQTTIMLGDGSALKLREPMASDLRGVKLIDVLQLDAQAHSVLLPRISDMSVAEFYALGAADSMAVMAAVVGFFALGEEVTMADSQSPSKTAGP